MHGLKRILLTRILLTGAATCVAAAYCATPAYATETITYGYDAKGRLIQIVRTDSVNNGVTTAYVLDKADNRTNKTISSLAPPLLAINDATVAEGSNAVFTVSLSSAPTNTVTVNYATADGTAAAGSDYTANSGSLTFTAGQTSKTISVATLSDAVSESNETFQVNLSNASGATFADSQGVGTITNVAPPPQLAINDATVAEGSNAVFTVSLSPAPTSTVTVNYATADGTAAAGSDYTANSGSLTFTAGQTSKTISVATLSDAVSESNETFQVNLSNASGATFADSQGAGTITNVVSNHNPVANNDYYSFTSLNLPKTYTLSPLVNDTDSDGDPLTITFASDYGVSIINNNTQLSFTADYPDSFTIEYTISDGHGGSATGVVEVNVSCTYCGY